MTSTESQASIHDVLMLCHVQVASVLSVEVSSAHLDRTVGETIHASVSVHSRVFPKPHQWQLPGRCHRGRLRVRGLLRAIR